MSKIVTLKQNWEFRRLYNRKNSYVSPALVIYFCKSHAGFSRLGITAGKKIGHAVERNRAKRIIRVAFNELKSDFKFDIDLVIVARAKAPYLSSDEITVQLRELLKKAAVID